jgi:hypothetical protein
MAVVPMARGGAGRSRHADGGIAEREEDEGSRGSRLGRVLRSLLGIVITSVPFHVPA